MQRGQLTQVFYEVTLTQGSFAEITNQRFSLKYHTFRQLAAAFISGGGSGNVWYFKENLQLVISAREP